MNNINEWILTDDASQQYVKEISTEEIPHTFKLIEMSLINPDIKHFEVYSDEICIDDYLETMRGELKEIIHSYSYYLDEDELETNDKNYYTSIWKYEDEAYQVMAECIFEYYGSFQAEQIFIGSETDCIKFIQNYIKNN